MEEGYIKFKANWTKSPAMPIRFIKKLNHWRGILYDLKLIGAYENGIGFGNISERFGKSDYFIISGSGTGNFETLTPDHYSQVTKIDIKFNTLNCNGPIVASSESMSHGVIYQSIRSIQGVIHVHHLAMWRELLHKVPTTNINAAYGTPEMAREILRLIRETDLPDRKIFVMAGHKEGIFAFGDTLDEAGEILLDYYNGL